LHRTGQEAIDMDAVAGIFPDAASAREAMLELRRAGSPSHATMLCPGTRVEDVLEKIPVDDTEKPGMGGAVSGVLGGVVGMTAVSLFFPGVGPVILAGMIASGIAGAAAGLTIGQQVERFFGTGLTRDEIDVYGAALRAGKAVVVAGAANVEQIDEIRDIFRAARAERVDPARTEGLAAILQPPPEQPSEQPGASAVRGRQ
jgi:hypothetical protein